MRQKKNQPQNKTKMKEQERRHLFLTERHKTTTKHIRLLKKNSNDWWNLEMLQLIFNNYEAGKVKNEEDSTWKVWVKQRRKTANVNKYNIYTKHLPNHVQAFSRVGARTPYLYSQRLRDGSCWSRKKHRGLDVYTAKPTLVLHSHPSCARCDLWIPPGQREKEREREGEGKNQVLGDWVVQIYASLWHHARVVNGKTDRSGKNQGWRTCLSGSRGQEMNGQTGPGVMGREENEEKEGQKEQGVRGRERGFWNRGNVREWGWSEKSEEG